MRLSEDAVGRLRAITQTPDLSGTRYRLVREIGRGGMGVVYEAEDVELERRVALKVVASDLPGPAAARLAGEAKVIARLEHPGIVPVFDSGLLPDGRLFYAMKLVRGRRLDEWAAAGHPRSERLRLFVRICEPLAWAHASGIVHRDLKPANVMVGEFGAVLVMDWGVAAAGAPEPAAIVGTAGFMAPEQERGELAGPRTDVFALGRILSFLLAGETVPRRLTAIVEKASASDPEARYEDAGILGEDVQRFLDGQPVRAWPEGALDRAGRWLDQNRVLVVLVAAYLVMRLIVFFWMRL